MTDIDFEKSIRDTRPDLLPTLERLVPPMGYKIDPAKWRKDLAEALICGGCDWLDQFMNSEAGNTVAEAVGDAMKRLDDAIELLGEVRPLVDRKALLEQYNPGSRSTRYRDLLARIDAVSRPE